MMPGSSVLSNESSKAKVTNGGIFVRPVAVSGIFCPVKDSDTKPPALPEKRRFSALTGDLRPSSSGSGSALDDFKSRRQSWDNKQKEVPFSQALLRKTSRNNAPTLRSFKSETSKEPVSDSGIPISSGSATIVTTVSSITTVSSSSGPKRSINELETKKETIQANCAVSDLKTTLSQNPELSHRDNFVVSTPTSSQSDNNSSENAPSNKIVSENVKTSKKVYGLIKRESKSNAEVDTVKEQKPVDANASLNRSKVYGVSKNSVKKEFTQDTQSKSLSSEKITTDISKNSVQKSPDSVDTKDEEEKVNRSSVVLPKDFRTVRRTSDVIAAKIQNIFSNFQSDKSVNSATKKSYTISEKSTTVEPIKELKISPIKKTPDTSANDLFVKNSSKSIGIKTISEKSAVDAFEKERESKLGKEVKDFNGKEASASSECCGGTAVNNRGADSSHTIEISKSVLPVSVLSSTQEDKKLADIEGKMPTKKADQNTSCDVNSFISANGESDRKSYVSAMSLNMLKDNANKDTRGVNKLSSFTGSSSLSSSVKILSKSSQPFAKISNYCNFSKSKETTSESHESEEVKESSVSKFSQSYVSSSFVQTSTHSDSSFINTNSTVQIESNTSVQGVTNKTTEVSKIEVSKITPSTLPGIVPTVNVLFRTKSPQGVINRDENRKKVVIETCASEGPISSAVIIPSMTNCLPSNSATESVKEAFKAVEDVQKTLNASPSSPKNHTIHNLKKEEIVTVPLSSNLNSDESRTDSVNNNCSSRAISSLEDNSKFSNTIVSVKPVLNNEKISDTSKFSPVDYNLDLASKPSSLLSTSTNPCAMESKMSVVDLGEWSRKFQNSDSEAPRVPLRRRAVRDSLPPSLPSRSTNISRYGSLKRIEDSPRYIPRSPSQSSLPQRYSYTEMLTKVCSMGVLPFIEPMNSKSCSSSSSQVSELWSELSEEQSTATHASEMLEAETTERMRLEKEVHELQSRYSQVQQRSDKMEMEMMETRMYRSPEINGDFSDDDETDGNSSIYKQKYERAVRDMEIMKRRMQQQQEEEMEQKAMMKKASEKKLAEAMEDIEEERQVANQWKRKAQKLGAELQDLRLMLEEQMGRNGELEKKQRRFDAELSTAQEEMKKERLLREKLTREKDQALSEKYSLEQDLQSMKLDSDLLHEKIAQLNRELDELTLSSKGEEEVTQLKRAKQELERKNRDQEEELEELAAQVQMLEQAKLRLEMSLEKVRQEHRREASVREEEIEEIRATFSKKIKNLEAQLETEQDERHQLMKQKHELERRIYELADQPPPQDPEIERRLRRDLKRTKALLRDAQSMLEHTREGQSSKTLIRQLKNQLEDSEFAKATAVKARQAIESELQDCQLQLEEVTRVKNESESRCLQLSREKSAIQTQLEEAEEEMAEVMKKYKAVVAQMSIDQKTLAEQNQQISDLETERNMLKDQLSEVSHKFEHLAGQSDDSHKVHWLDSKVRDLESKLELEQTTKTRLENQISRLKEQNDRAREESDSLRNKEMQAQEGVRRLQRQLRDLREDYSALQQKEADAYRKQHELEMALENTETDLQVTKNDLRLACQRIQDLQNALEDDIDSGTDVPDESGSDSDDSFDLSALRNTSITPVQRCESVASNLSFCTTEEVPSRTNSFSRELSAFSSRDDVEKDVNGLPRVTSGKGLNLENDEAT